MWVVVDRFSGAALHNLDRTGSPELTVQKSHVIPH
jgi:hypothetical protein